MPIVSQGQITITDLNDGINGKTYILNILNGVRSVTYDQNGINPSPSQTAFSCELYEDGVLKTPSSYSWKASGLLSGTSTSSTFTPTCAPSFSSSNNNISLEVVYDEQTIKTIVPIAITKTGDKGNNGDNAIIAVLSNETHTVPTDSSGNNGVYTGANTTIYIYNGVTDDSSNWTFSASSSSGVTGTLAGRTYTVTAMTTDIGYVDLIASRNGYTNITKRFTITKAKQGLIGATGSSPTAYKLISNTAAIAKDINNIYTPTTVTFSSTSATGSSAPVAYSGRFIISESTDGSSFTTKYTSSANESSKVYTPSANIKAIKARLYLAGGTTTLLDEQTVPIVCDGVTGPQGPQGEALDTFDGVFSEDTKFWSTSYNSNVKPGENVQAKTSSTSIYGGKTLKIANDTWLYSKNPIAIEDGKVYKFTFRVRQLQNPTDTTKNKVYAGATEFAHDGSRVSVNNGTYFVTSSYSLSVKWISVSGDTAPSTYDPTKDNQYDWVEITKYMSTTAKTAIMYGAEQKFPAVGAFTAGTKYIKPMFIVNYSSGNGIAEVDCLNVEDVTSLYEATRESANKINNNAQEIFDKVTQEGVNQGLFINNGKVYINGEYINAKNLRVQNTAGDLTFGVDSNGDITIKPNSFSLTPSSTNQNTVVNLLNNNTSSTSTSNGIYLSGSNLYVNASNIKTGRISANSGGSYLDLNNGSMMLGTSSSSNYLQWTGSSLTVKADNLSLGGTSVATTTDVSNAVSNVQIGGRNLMKNSKITSTFSSFTGGTNTTMFYRNVYLTPDIKAGDKITVSLTYRYKNIALVTGQESNARIYVQGSGNVTGWTSGFSSGPNIVSKITLGNASELEYYQSYTFTLSASQVTNSYFSVGFRTDYIQSGELYIYEMKVEKGDRPTAWTPAPEDNVTSVDTMYYVSTSSVSQSGGSWSTTFPTPSTYIGKYIWTKTVTTYLGGTTTETSPTLYQPDWVQDWEGTKISISNTSVLSPKIFAGTKETDGSATGVALGTDIFGTGADYSGIAGYKKGVKTFHFKTDGTLLIGQNTTGNHIAWDGSNLSLKANSISIGITPVATGDDVKNSINNIQLGGRNLLKCSDFENEKAPLEWDIFAGVVSEGFLGHDSVNIDNSTATSGYVDKLRQVIHNGVDKILEPSQWYTLSFYVKGTGKVRTHVYSSLVDTSAKGFVDNVEKTLASDGYCDWTLTSDWVRHVYTFKTKSTLPSADNYLLFRVPYGNNVYVCMPQLEKGNKESDWSRSFEDMNDQIALTEDIVNDNIDKAVSTLRAELTDEIAANYVNNDTFNNFVGSVGSQFDQVSSDISSTFDTANSYIKDVDGKLQEYQDSIATYIRINNGVDIGQLNSSFSSRFDNTKIAFSQDGQEILTIADNAMYTTEANIDDRLKIGDSTKGFFVWEQGTSGNLTLKWSDK